MLTKNQQLEKQRVPKLRFVGFEHVWEEKSLAEVAKIITGQTPPTVNRDFYGGDYLFVSPVDFDGQRYITETKTTCTRAGFDKVRKVEKDSVLFVCIGSTIGKIAQAKKDCITNQQINSLTSNNGNSNDFIYFNLLNKSPKIKLLAGKQAVPMINKSDFSKIKSMFTSIEEQQKIASFLGSVDEWVENLKKQKENLELYKKGIMQKIFSQEICFKDEDGKEFPKWEGKRLSEIGKSYNGLQGKSGEDFGEGEPYITYKQIFDSSELDVQKFSLVKIGNNEKQNKAQFGDIFFTVSSETPFEVGFASVLLNKEVSPYLNSFSFGFRTNSLKEFDPYFLKFFFRTQIYRKEVIKLAQGSTRYNISKVEFIKMSFKFPTLSEQQKIADFLNSIDKVIESKQEQITQAENWKKGLMQKMFV